jgi:hypothetical protein
LLCPSPQPAGLVPEGLNIILIQHLPVYFRYGHILARLFFALLLQKNRQMPRAAIAEKSHT